MTSLQLSQVGCGGMGLRHVYGLIELKRTGFDTFDLVAVCDLHQSVADHVAGVAEDGLGLRPRTYTDLDAMLEGERGLDAMDIVTDTRTHHTFALKAFDAGLHVAVEKPMGLTVRACRQMIDGARRAQRVLSISENYRRDPMNRLVKAILQSGAIGEPRLLIAMSTGGGRNVRQVAAWRHLKLRGGVLLEYGVHTSDLVLYFMGPVDRVFAETSIWEKKRYLSQAPSHLHRFYGHREKEDIDEAEYVSATAEDMGLAVLRFASGAAGQITFSDATPGQALHADAIYGSDASLVLPGSRSGKSVTIVMEGSDEPLAEQDVMALVPDFELDDVTARFFEAHTRLASFEMPFDEVDRKLISIELQDFAEAILTGRNPEVTGEVGLGAVALSYSVLESGYTAQPVIFRDVLEDRTNGYQAEINESVGL